jgi:hypothetical protein
MTVTVKTSFDASQRELVVDIASMIYKMMGYKAPTRINYFYESQHPTEQAVLSLAEEIYEMFVGDSPSYEDEEDAPN